MEEDKKSTAVQPEEAPKPKPRRRKAASPHPTAFCIARRLGLLFPTRRYIGKRNIAVVEVEIAYVCVAICFDASFIECTRVELDSAEQAAYARHTVVVIHVFARVVRHFDCCAVAADSGDTRSNEIFIIDLFVGRTCI